MRFRLLRRRLTISAPRMAVRSALPWPLRWLVFALVLGLSAAAALWAFEFGRSLTGMDAASREELQQLRTEVAQLREEKLQRESNAHGADSLLLAERTAVEQITARLRLVEGENRALREDLGLFEKLIPTAGDTQGVAIRGLQAEVVAGVLLRWQALVMRTIKNAPELKGRLEITLSGVRDGKPWSQTVNDAATALQLRQFRRLEGSVELPAQAVVKTVTARIWEGSTLLASQTTALGGVTPLSLEGAAPARR